MPTPVFNVWIGGGTDPDPNDPEVGAYWDQGHVPTDNEHAVVPAGVDSENAIGAGSICAANPTDTYPGTGTNPRLAAFTVEEGYDLTIGEPDPGTGDRYLMVDAAEITLAGTGESYVDCWYADRIVVTKAGTAAGAGEQMLYLKGTGNFQLDIQAGGGEKIGLAGLAGEEADFTTINISGGNVYIGPGVTCTTLNVYGGVVENAADIATINVYGGSLENHGDCTGTITLRGGVMYYRGSGTTNTVTVSGDGTLDLSLDSQARGFGTTEVHQGASFRDPWTTVTYSKSIELRHCGIGDVTLDFGDHIKFMPVKIS
ncbi:MAG: hypothetical protein ACYS8X_13625 [Planctomycetota bacterium]|jgi:hypothetical protein